MEEATSLTVCVNYSDLVEYYVEEKYSKKLNCTQLHAYCKKCNHEVWVGKIDDLNQQKYWESKEAK